MFEIERYRACWDPRTGRGLIYVGGLEGPERQLSFEQPNSFAAALTLLALSARSFVDDAGVLWAAPEPVRSPMPRVDTVRNREQPCARRE